MTDEIVGKKKDDFDMLDEGKQQTCKGIACYLTRSKEFKDTLREIIREELADPIEVAKTHKTTQAYSDEKDDIEFEKELNEEVKEDE